jgi:dihydroflavonol-4-reductase
LSIVKAVVLGATGFIGSHIVRALIDDDIDVRILRRQSSPNLALKGLKVEESIGDLNDKESLLKAFKGCHVLFHAAGYYPLYSFERKEQKAIALRQMKNVLEAAEEAHVKKIVYTSSMSTIGRRKNGKLSNEETRYDPKFFTGLYYEIKYLLEQEALAAAKRGLPVTIVNPTGVFGDYDVKPTSGILVVQIAKGKVPLIIDAPMNAVDVRDVAKGQIAAMKQGKIGKRYLLGGHNTSVREVAKLIAKLLKVAPPKLKIPLFLGEIASFSSEVVGKYLLHQEKPFFPRIGIDFLKYGMHYDTSRAQTEFGLKTTPLEETFERAIAWFRKHKYFE